MNTSHIFLLATGTLIAFALTAFSGRIMIPWLHKMKFGQTIRDVGPSWHKNKQGTPTMGGLMFIFGSMAAFLICLAVCQLFMGINIISMFPRDFVRIYGGVIMALCCAAIGFVDDYIIIVKKRNLGLNASQKMFAQLLVSFGYALMLYSTKNTQVHIPFYGMVDFGIWIIPFCIFVIAAMTNSVNFTDGVDGLCGTVSFVVTLFFIVAAGIINDVLIGLTGAVFAGALAGFLVWNLHPARVFMGNTGSLFTGGLITALAFGINRPLLLLPAGIIYVAEVLSVILQVLYFKATKGKRMFKMSPIHHHYEMSGFSEMKIVVLFTLVTLIGCGIAGVLVLYS